MSLSSTPPDAEEIYLKDAIRIRAAIFSCILVATAHVPANPFDEKFPGKTQPKFDVGTLTCGLFKINFHSHLHLIFHHLASFQDSLLAEFFEMVWMSRPFQVTERKTKQDWACFLEEIADRYESAEKITLVMDNLNTHEPGALYETFKPEKAKELWDRFEFVYTPKHGSWLNMAEIELNVLTGQCLKRRIDDIFFHFFY